MAKSANSMSKSAFFHVISPDIGLPDVKICRYGKRFLQSWMIPMRSLPLWHLYWNKSSCCELVFADRTVKIPSNVLAIIPSHTVFATRMDGPFEHFHIDFTVSSSRFASVRKREIFIPVKKYLPFLRKTFEDPVLQTMHMYSLLFEVLLDIPGECFKEDEEERPDPRILTAIEFIERNSASELNNYILCRKAGMSIGNFQRLFKKSTNLTPKQYVVNLRLDAARNLLLNDDLPISEIAMATGFADRYHFSKAFKSFFKIPPAVFRQNHRKTTRSIQIFSPKI